jgi:two-component system OmpR family sensor kinase
MTATTTRTTMTVSATTEGPPAAARHGLRTWLASLRVRVSLRYVLLLALATAGSILVAREVIVAQIDDRIDEALTQEVRELERLKGGRDPETGRPLGQRVRRIFDLYLQRNVPTRGEAFLTFVDGEPYRRSARVVPYRLDQDPELVRRWGSIDRSDRGHVSTPGGEIEFLAVPLQGGGETRGVFVVAIFRHFETDDLGTITAALAGVGAAVLLIGALLTWRGAQRVIAPMHAVTRTAHQITETDLSRRIPVQGEDEVAELARTFNEMLDRLESAFATQRRFLDDAGHELRTPITIVRGHLELMGDDPQERRETLALVMDELERMSRLVDDVLTLAKTEQPDFLDYETVDVAALSREVYAKAAALAPRDWRLEQVGRGMIVADRQRLTQALVQLAQNAVQHTGDGDAIALSSSVAAGRARFSVRDSGSGIAAGDRERIFERFGRGAAARREGAGLGLAIVRAIAEAHGGRVDVDSRSGGGATFSVEVPVDPPRGAPAEMGGP